MDENPNAYESRVLGTDCNWICPGCQAVLGCAMPGRHLCPCCGRQIDCSIEMEPTCVARLADPREFRRTLQ